MDNHSGMFLREDLAIFLHPNLNAQLYFIFRNRLNHLCACITSLGDHVRSPFGMKTCPVSAKMSLFVRGSAL